MIILKSHWGSHHALAIGNRKFEHGCSFWGCQHQKVDLSLVYSPRRFMDLQPHVMSWWCHTPLYSLPLRRDPVFEVQPQRSRGFQWLVVSVGVVSRGLQEPSYLSPNTVHILVNQHFKSYDTLANSNSCLHGCHQDYEEIFTKKPYL